MDFRSVLMGLAFAFMWSSAFTSARIIVAEAPPIMSLALRFLISGSIGAALALMMGQSWRLTRAQWKGVIVFGICQNALYLGLNFVAMQTIEASLASIIASTMPLLVALAGWLTAVPALVGQNRHPLPDTSEAAIMALAKEGLAKLRIARNEPLPKQARRALLAGWQSEPLLKLAIKEPARVLNGTLELAPFRAQIRLARLALTNRW